MITLDKTKSFDSFMVEIKAEFHNPFLVNNLKYLYSAPYIKDNKIKNISKFLCGLDVIAEAVKEELGIDNENRELKYHSKEMSKISDFLSFSSEAHASKYLLKTPYIEDDFFYNVMEYTFYAMVLLDAQVFRRFKTAYTLWQHSVEFGIAGYSEKFKKFYPYYLTYFGNKIFIVNPIKGEVKGFERAGSLREKKITGLLTGTLEEKRVALAATSEGVYVPLVEENLYGTIKEVQPTHLAQSDRKRAERERKREKGLKVEETPWLTTALDSVEGSAYNIRTHSLIALMVYGLEVMKYGIMESNSIFTIDHIDGRHNNNKIENLQLLTRKSNDQKKNKPNSFYFDYFGYWEKQVKQAKINQNNLNYRINAE